MAIVYVDSAATGLGTGLNWTDAFTSILLARSDATNPVVAGDDVYVASGHSTTYGSLSAHGLPTDVSVYSVNKSTDVYTPGALEQTTTVVDLILNSVTNSLITYSGFTFKSGDDLSISTGNNNKTILRDCAIELTGTSSLDQINTNTADASNSDCYNTSFTFGANSQGFRNLGGRLMRFYECSFSGSNRIINASGGGGGFTFELFGCDLTGLNALTTEIFSVGGSSVDDTIIIRLHKCKLPTDIVTNGFVESPMICQSLFVEVISCTDGTDHDTYHYFYYQNYEGVVEEDTTAYLNATYDGANGFSAKMTTSSHTKICNPLRYKLCELPAQDLTDNTTYIVNFESNTALKDTDFFIEVVRPDATDNALSVIQTSQPDDILSTGTTHTTNTESWSVAKTNKYEDSLTVTGMTGVDNANVEVWVNLVTPSIDVWVDPFIIVT